MRYSLVFLAMAGGAMASSYMAPEAKMIPVVGGALLIAALVAERFERR